jgi:3'-5' exoribonuclease 1
VDDGNDALPLQVEATCADTKDLDWPNEIIEFPVVLLRWRQPLNTGDNSAGLLTDAPDVAGPSESGISQLYIASTFHSYVRPTWHPKLSTFCTSLTGITQVSSLGQTLFGARTNRVHPIVGHGGQSTNLP